MPTNDAPDMMRRKMLAGAPGVAAGAAAGISLTIPAIAASKTPVPTNPTHQHNPKGKTVNFITTKDGTNLFYKDWGKGPVVVFSHGWPLNADAWEDQLFFLATQGYRVIAHDRRGHGRSSQPWQGNDMDTYADDLATVIDTLDVRDVTLVGHSTGGGEVARYIGRHGTSRVKRAVLVGAIPPIMLQSATNPGGTPLSAFDGIRAGLLADRSQFYKDLSAPFYGANLPGSKVSRASGMHSGHKACWWALTPLMIASNSSRNLTSTKI
jgi:non-heme chloroperoxidase